MRREVVDHAIQKFFICGVEDCGTEIADTITESAEQRLVGHLVIVHRLPIISKIGLRWMKDEDWMCEKPPKKS